METRSDFGVRSDLGGDCDGTLVAYIKAQLGSGKFTLNMQDVSGNLSITRCHLPLKLTNFGTLVTVSALARHRLLSSPGSVTTVARSVTIVPVVTLARHYRHPGPSRPLPWPVTAVTLTRHGRCRHEEWRRGTLHTTVRLMRPIQGDRLLTFRSQSF